MLVRNLMFASKELVFASKSDVRFKRDAVRCQRQLCDSAKHYERDSSLGIFNDPMER
jgi:hypothetical protein